MSGTLMGVIAVGLVILILWIWMNAALVRGRSRQINRADVQGDGDIAQAQAEQETGIGTETQSVHEDEPATSQPIAGQLEVVHEGRRSAAQKVFDRPDHPFVLRPASVPLFQDEVWLQCFRQLTSDSRVLGWMAFAGDSIGASDRDYDQSFVDVLRNYWRSLEKLRREAGLSNVRENSIVADEGNVWVLTTREDTWFALFVDSSLDVHEITDRLLGSLVES